MRSPKHEHQRYEPTQDFFDDDEDDETEFELTGTPYNQKTNITQLWHHHSDGKQGHQKKHHFGSHHDRSSSSMRSPAPRKDPYREWLDSLPEKSMETAK